jgi:hypothetical protein
MAPISLAVGSPSPAEATGDDDLDSGIAGNSHPTEVGDL